MSSFFNTARGNKCVNYINTWCHIRAPRNYCDSSFTWGCNVIIYKSVK